MIHHEGTCPRCDVALGGHPVANVMPLACPICGGTFFRGRELKAALGCAAEEILCAERLLPYMDAAACPNACGPMRRIFLGDGPQRTPLDLCATCGGVWFDRGELKTVLQLVQAKTGGSPELTPAACWLAEGTLSQYEDREQAEGDAPQGDLSDLVAGRTGLPVPQSSRATGIPWVTGLCAATCIWVSCMQWANDPEFTGRWALVPDGFQWAEDWPRLVSSMFMHADTLHMLGNLYFLVMCWMGVEGRLGRLAFAVLYLLSGLAAGLSLLAVTLPHGTYYLGASGAIAGVLGAHAVLLPHTKVSVRLRSFLPDTNGGAPYRAIVVRVPAWGALGFWMAWQLVAAHFWPNEGIAYQAHIGGFLGGLVLGVLGRLWVPDARLAAVAVTELEAGRPPHFISSSKRP